MKHRKADEWLKAGVAIGSDVDLTRIASDAVIHPGSCIKGAETSIGPGSIIGEETPATVENCQLGRNVRLKGGFFSGAAFFEGVELGSGAHVRAGTILEEQASVAHTVGLKQTILFPFVTLGSMINFCDLLMAGGTHRKNHSEVGSSYVHFNYTPHQDKATASLIGNVSEGVFLDKNPIFLGGQGGLVGPVGIAYGSVVAAGSITRRDIVSEDQLHVLDAPEPRTQPYNTGVYPNVDRLVRNNLLYIGNLTALKEWYRNVRHIFMRRDNFDKACLTGGLKNIDLVLSERIQRLGELAQNMKYSFQWLEKQDVPPETTIATQRMLHNTWETMKFELTQSDWKENTAARDAFLAAMDNMPVGGSYIKSIQSLDSGTRESGRQWLNSIISAVVDLWSVKSW